MPEGRVEVPSGALLPGNVEAFRVSLGDLRSLLATQGLRIVGEAEAKVLEACAAISDRRVRDIVDAGRGFTLNPHLVRIAQAELARRAAKEET